MDWSWELRSLPPCLSSEFPAGWAAASRNHGALGRQLSICLSLMQQLPFKSGFLFVRRKAFEANRALKILSKQFHLGNYACGL
jgi:hypothetical protein